MGRGVQGDLESIKKSFERKEQDATLDTWLLTLPGVGTIWTQFILYVVHLRDIPEQEHPTHRDNEYQSHEIGLWALDPDIGPYTFENLASKSRKLLTPANFIGRLELATDDEVRQLLPLIAKGLVEGAVPCEPDDHLNFKERWWAILHATLEHIRFGGHPQGRN